MRALGRLAQIGQDDLLAQLADGLGQRALGVGGWVIEGNGIYRRLRQ